MQILLLFNILFFSAPFFLFFAHANSDCHDKIFILIEMKGDDQVFWLFLQLSPVLFLKAHISRFPLPPPFKSTLLETQPRLRKWMKKWMGWWGKLENLFSKPKHIFLLSTLSLWVLNGRNIVNVSFLLLRTSFRLSFFRRLIKRPFSVRGLKRNSCVKFVRCLTKINVIVAPMTKHKAHNGNSECVPMWWRTFR